MKSSFSGSSSVYATWPPRAGLPAPVSKIVDTDQVPRFIEPELPPMAFDPLPEPEPEPEIVEPKVAPTEAELRWYEDVMTRSEKRVVFTITVTITPGIAGLLLLYNNINRTFNPNGKVYKGMVRDIRAGHFDHNGETIKLAYTRQLNDGQHRLRAIEETGIAIVVEVTFGLTPESRLSVDQGQIRNAGGQLTLLGHPDGNNLANAASRIMTYEKVARFTLLTNTLRPTFREIQTFCETHDLTMYVMAGRSINHKIGLKSGLGAALYYILAQIDPVAAARFFTALGTGSETAGPIFKLREMLTTDGRKPKALQMSDHQIADVTIQFWNAWRTRHNPRGIKPPPAGQGLRNPFPKPV